MAYATAQDMITRFGQAEILRLTTPEGQPLDVIDQDRLNLVLADASALMDSYLRRRYLTPVSPVPQELARACCILARDDLAHGDGRQPSEQMQLAASATRKWLRELFDGTALLADATPAGEQSFAQAQVRGAQTGDGCPAFSDRPRSSGWPTPEEFWNGV